MNNNKNIDMTYYSWTEYKISENNERFLEINTRDRFVSDIITNNILTVKKSTK